MDMVNSYAGGQITIAFNDNDFKISNCRFENNSNDGKILDCGKSKGTIENTVFYNNSGTCIGLNGYGDLHRIDLINLTLTSLSEITS